MKPAVIAGILLIIVGIIGLVYQGVGFNKRKEVLAVGPVHATKDTHETIPIPPAAGALALIGGIVLVVSGSRSRG